IALACLMQVGYGETQPPRLTGAELADQIVRGKLPPIEELSVVEKEVLVEELVRRFQEYRRSKRDDRPHSSSVIRDVIHPLMVLGHRETFKHVLDDYRGGWRTRFDMDIGFIQQPELLVMLMDDYLFVEEEIDWTQYDNYARLYMKTIHQVAAEVLLRYVRTQD